MRNLGATNLAASLEREAKVAFFAELDFSGGFVRAWTGTFTLATLGRSFQGAGSLGSVSPIKESGGTSPQKLAFELSGIPSALVNSVFNENYRNRAARLWMGFMNAGSTALLDDPFLFWAGRMDVCSIEDTGDTAKITVKCESILKRVDIANSARFSDQDQKQRFPGDRFFEYMAGAAERPIYWGGPGPAGDPGYG